jgi:hypothetical protein
MQDMPYLGQPAVRIPYRDASGQETAIRFRLRMAKGEERDDRFRWRNGDKPIPYGLERLDRARRAGHVVLVEGESDCHTLWYFGVPALGLPGTSTWKNEWADWLSDIPIVYLLVEPDPAGEALLKKVSQSPLRSRLQVIRLADAKDPSDLYLSHPEDFSTRWQAAMVTAVAFEDEAAQARVAAAEAAWEKCADLAQEQRILDALVYELHRLGAVGEERAAKLIFLAIVSRFLDRPVSLALKGPSAAGKSFTTETVLRFFPPSAYYALTAMSERALAYSNEPLSHRMLVLYEAAGMSGEFAPYLLRSLLSEGRIRYETVDKTEQGSTPRLIERPGPTGLIVTTTALKLHPENETRLLSVPVNDTREQTAQVLRSVADDGTREEIDFSPWHALQVVLEAGEHRVSIPYALTLADMIPPLDVRLRRDFKLLLGLIQAHAILHQATRKRDLLGRIVATLDDYAAVYELVADLIGEALQATVSAAIRETVEAVAMLLQGDKQEVCVKDVADKLGLDRSAASRRIADAERAGYLQNLESRRGQAKRLVLGESLPADQEVLPTPEALDAMCRCAGVTGGIDTPLPPPPDVPEQRTTVVTTASDIPSVPEDGGAHV